MEMIIMSNDAKPEDISRVVEEIKKLGLKTDVSQGEYRTVIGIVGDERKVSFDRLNAMPGVKEARPIEAPYKLISKEFGRMVDAALGYLLGTAGSPGYSTCPWTRPSCSTSSGSSRPCSPAPRPTPTR